MRILHIDTEKGFRGGERQVLWLMEGLRSRGVGQALLARAGSELALRAGEEGHRVIPAAATPPWDPRLRWQMHRLAGREFDLLHAHTGNAHSIAVTAAGSAAVVVTRRVDFPARGRKYSRPGVHFIAISTAIARILETGGAPPARIALVPSGIELPPAASPGARARLRRDWDAPGETPVFGMVGSYVDHKDPVNLVRAAERLGALGLEDFRVVLVGEGELRAELEASIARAGLVGRVILAGWRTDVRDCMEAMDVFVMPSKLEGLCTSLLDAQAVGLPCVACAAGGIPDIITDGDNGWLVPPRDPGALAGAMAAVWADPSERRRRAARGPAVVAERFTVERMVEGTLAVYHGALGSA